MPMHGVLLTDSSAGTSLSQTAAVAIALLGLIYFSFIRPLRNKKQKDPLAQQPLKSSLAQQRSVERDMSALLVEYEQMIRQMTTQIEIRVTKLEMLISEADRKLVELKIASARPSRDGVAAQSIQSRAERLDRDGREVVESARALAEDVRTSPVRRTDPISDSPKFDEPTSPPVRDVYALADEGHSIGEIARRSGRMYGEVELILALRSQQDDAAKQANDDLARSSNRPSRDADSPESDSPPLDSSRSELSATAFRGSVIERNETIEEVGDREDAMSAAVSIARQLSAGSQNNVGRNSHQNKHRKKHRR